MARPDLLFLVRVHQIVQDCLIEDARRIVLKDLERAGSLLWKISTTTSLPFQRSPSSLPRFHTFPFFVVIIPSGSSVGVRASSKSFREECWLDSKTLNPLALVKTDHKWPAGILIFFTFDLFPHFKPSQSRDPTEGWDSPYPIPSPEILILGVGSLRRTNQRQEMHPSMYVSGWSQAAYLNRTRSLLGCRQVCPLRIQMKDCMGFRSRPKRMNWRGWEIEWSALTSILFSKKRSSGRTSLPTSQFFFLIL